MNTPLSAACAALFVAATAVAQGNPIALPPFNNVYNGFSRGFSFVAQTGFEFVQMGLPVDAFQPGDTGAYLVEINGNQAVYQTGVAPGANGEATITIPAGTCVIAPGDTVLVVGNWSPAAPAQFTAHNSYGLTAPFATTIEGVAHTLDRAGVQWDIGDPAGSATAARFTGVAGSIGRVLVETGPLTVTLPPSLVATAEAIPFSNTLDGAGGQFRGGDVIRWNYDDSISSGANNGTLCITTLNLGAGGAPAVASTPLLPGFVQQWAGSSPAGNVLPVGPYFVGSPDELLIVPPGVLNQFDGLRLQSLIYAPTAPVEFQTMYNVINFSYTNCGFGESFDTTPTGQTLPTGWAQNGIQNWRVQSGGTTSGGTGPTSAFDGSNYIYAETSSPSAAGDTYIADTVAIPSSSAPNSTLSFQLSRIGATIGTLNVYMDDGAGTFNLLSTYTGPDANQSQGGVEWTGETVDLTNGGTLTVPANIVLRFEYIRGSSFTGDLAIDGICLN
ncbi:MAG: hypothetical protein ACON4Z_07210 [Planctomycetota bacterium]